MRTILAIETSTTTARIALVRADEVLFEDSCVSERSHNARIFGPLGQALDVAEPDAIVVGTGPGSYTGIRIGISAAAGLAAVRGIPMVGLCSLLGLADEAGRPVNDARVVGDARRGQVWMAEISGREVAVAPRPMSAVEALPRCAGTRTVTPDAVCPPGLEDCPVETVAPSAAQLATRVGRLGEEEFDALASGDVAPIYLAAPFVTQPRKIGK